MRKQIIGWVAVFVLAGVWYATAQTLCTENRCYKLQDELGFYIDNANPLPVETHTFVAQGTICNENRCVKLVDKDGYYITATNPLPTTGGGGGGSGTVTSVATTSPITGGTFTTSGTIGILASALDQSIYACQDAGSTDTYACTLPGAPIAYVTGGHYRFKANTANTGAATVNFSSIGPITIKKAVGGVTTDLADNDIRAGQWVDLVYDGTNMQMQSVLGNAGASTLTLQQAFANGKSITGANSFANAFLVGDGTDTSALFTDATQGPILQCVIGGVQNGCNYRRRINATFFWSIDTSDGATSVFKVTPNTNLIDFVLGSDATGDIWYRNSSGHMTRLGIGASTTVLHGGTTPSYSQIVNADITNSTIDLTAKVTGILPSANGGTANGFTKFSGPTTSEKTFTLPNASSTLTITVASGAKALATSAISSAACSSAQTDTATGTATTDVVMASFNGDPTAVTGYVPLTSGMLTIIAYPTADTVNFKVCNNTTASITPGAITLNWRVVR